MIDGVRETRKKRNHNARLPLSAFSVSTNDAVDERVANLVLNRRIVHDGAELPVS